MDSQAVCIIKPGLQMNAIMRSLKRIAEINCEGMTPKDENFVQISNIEMRNLD